MNVLFKNLILIFLIFSVVVSYGQEYHAPDTLKNILIIKQITEFQNIKEIEADSNFMLFHIFRPSQKKSISISQLGNIGLPTISNIFHERNLNYNSDFMFNNPFRLYLTEPTDVEFYNTRRPYTKVKHTSSTKEEDEQYIRFIHSQNFNPKLNFTFVYDLISSQGQYPNQQTKDRNIILNSNYQTEKYSLYAAVNLNKFDVQNNGGIIDTGFVDINAPETNLSSASTLLKNDHIFVLQEYRIGNTKTVLRNDSMVEVLEPLIKFSHCISQTGRRRIYQDKQSFENGYYTNFYIQKDYSLDSIFLQIIENTISMHSEPLFVENKNFGVDLNLSNAYKSYYNFKEYIFLENKHHFLDTKISGNIFQVHDKKIKLDFSGEYFFTGYRQGDHKASAGIKFILGDSTKKIITLRGNYHSSVPDYFFNIFYSNHFRWENEFNSEINARASIIFDIPNLDFRLTAQTSLLNNYTFFSSVALPTQFEDWLYVYSASVKKDFHLGKVHFFNELTWQKSSNPDIISLPQIAAYHSTSIEMNIENSLTMYIGFDIKYSTKYKVYNYMPGHGMFYFENESFAGNYPLAGVYINGKIKKNVLVFIKFVHINSNIFRELYYTVNHYPLNNRMFKFGVQWTFTN